MISIITMIANVVGIPPILLLSICWQESHFKNVINHFDSGSQSYGICQIKYATAKDIIPNVTRKELMNPDINAFIAAKYLKKHIDTYKNEEKVISRYNGGLKNGIIINNKYVKQVLKHQKEKPWNFQKKK